MNIKINWWKTNFNNKFYKIYYYYLKLNYSAYIDNLINFADLNKNDKILDLACGSGNHLIALRNKGFNNLTGIDYHYANLARKNIRNFNIKIKKGDMRKIFGVGVYDFIMIASTSFGYFSENDNKKVLKNCYKALKPGGKLFIDNLSLKFVINNFQAKDWKKFKTNVFFLEERELSKDKKYLSSNWYLIEKGKLYKLANKLRLYSSKEFNKLFREVGFRKTKIKELKAHNWFLSEK